MCNKIAFLARKYYLWWLEWLWCLIGPHSACIFCVFPRWKAAGAWSWPLSFMRYDRNEWSYNFTHPYARITWSFIRYSDNLCLNTQNEMWALNIKTKRNEIGRRMYKKWRDSASWQCVINGMFCTNAWNWFAHNWPSVSVACQCLLYWVFPLPTVFKNNVNSGTPLLLGLSDYKIFSSWRVCIIWK